MVKVWIDRKASKKPTQFKGLTFSKYIYINRRKFSFLYCLSFKLFSLFFFFAHFSLFFFYYSTPLFSFLYFSSHFSLFFIPSIILYSVNTIQTLIKTGWQINGKKCKSYEKRLFFGTYSNNTSQVTTEHNVVQFVFSNSNPRFEVWLEFTEYRNIEMNREYMQNIWRIDRITEENKWIR